MEESSVAPRRRTNHATRGVVIAIADSFAGVATALVPLLVEVVSRNASVMS